MKHTQPLNFPVRFPSAHHPPPASRFRFSFHFLPRWWNRKWNHWDEDVRWKIHQKQNSVVNNGNNFYSTRLCLAEAFPVPRGAFTGDIRARTENLAIDFKILLSDEDFFTRYSLNDTSSGLVVHRIDRKSQGSLTRPLLCFVSEISAKLVSSGSETVINSWIPNAAYLTLTMEAPSTTALTTRIFKLCKIKTGYSMSPRNNVTCA